MAAFSFDFDNDFVVSRGFEVFVKCTLVIEKIMISLIELHSRETIIFQYPIFLSLLPTSLISSVSSQV